MNEQRWAVGLPMLLRFTFAEFADLIGNTDGFFAKILVLLAIFYESKRLVSESELDREKVLKVSERSQNPSLYVPFLKVRVRQAIERK